jgi:pyruvate kinase
MGPPLRIFTTVNRIQFTDSELEEAARYHLSGARLIAKGFPPGALRDAVISLQSRWSRFGAGKVMLDLPGSKPHVSSASNRHRIAVGGRVRVTTETSRLEGDGVRVVNLEPLLPAIEPGHHLIVADGAAVVRIVSMTGSELTGEVIEHEAEIAPGRSVVFPDSLARLQALTSHDIESLRECSSLPISHVAVSMVNSPDDLHRTRALLAECHIDAHVVAKIETFDALSCLDAIVTASDEVMVARGDLGLQLPRETLGRSQSRIIAATKREGRPAWAATGLLASLGTSAMPSIAEVSDLFELHERGVHSFLLSDYDTARQPARLCRCVCSILNYPPREKGA